MSIASFLIGIAHAQSDYVETPCTALQPGCGAGEANVLYTSLQNLGVFSLQVITGLAVLMIVWNGFQLVTNWSGDESKITKGRTSVMFTLFGLAVAIGSQIVISFVATQEYGQSSSGGNLIIIAIAHAIDIIRIVLNPLFVVVVVYAGFKMVTSAGESGGYESGRKMVEGAILGAIIVNVANALVQGVTTYFGL